MKKLIASLLLFSQIAFATNQHNLGTATATTLSVGTTSAPAASALIDMVSTSKGLAPPRMTTTQRDAISSPATGLIIYNTTTNQTNVYNGTIWTTVGGSGAGGIFAGGQNLISNNSFETDTTGYTASGGTFARTTTNGQFIPPGVAGAHWDSNAAAQTVCYTATTINANDGISGRNAAISIALRAASGTATHLLYAYDGTNILASTTITSSTTQFVRTSLNFSFPASGTIAWCLKSVASDEPDIYFDDLYLGLAEGFNLSQLSQATAYGSITYAGATNCSWQRTGGGSNTIGSFAADTDCTAAAVTGAITAPGTKLPAAVGTNMPPGEYLVIAEFGGRKGGVADDEVFWDLYDGATSQGVQAFYPAATQYFLPVTLVGHYSYTSTASHTFEVRGATLTTTNSVQIQNTGVDTSFTIKIYRFPSSAENAYRPELYNWRVDATEVSAAGISLGTGNAATYGGITDGSVTLTNNTSTTGNVLTAQIPCSATNPPTGTTCAAGLESLGVSFTLPIAGDVEACVDFTYQADVGDATHSGSLGTAFQIVETPNAAQTISQEGKGRTSSNDQAVTATTRQIVAFPYHVCGTFSFTSAGQKTLRLFFEQAVTGTVNNSIVYIDGNATLGQQDAHWVVKPLTQVVPAPVLLTPSVYVFYTGNAGTALTANVTNLDWSTKVQDNQNAWNGTTFTAPKSSFCTFSGSAFTTAGVTATLSWYVGGTIKQALGGGASARVFPINFGYYLNQNDTVTFRSDTTATLSNSATLHWISIFCP